MRRWIAYAAVLASASLCAAEPGDAFPDLPGLDDGLAQPGNPAAAHLSVRAVPRHMTLPPGEPSHVALEVTLAPGWYYYSPRPGGEAQAGEVTAHSDVLKLGRPLWPPHERKSDPEVGQYNIYKKQFVVYVPVRAPAGAPPGPARVRLTLGGQICAEREQGGQCIPLQGLTDQTIDATAEVAVGPKAVVNPDWTDAFSAGLDQAVPAEQLGGAGAPAAAPPASAVQQQAARYGLWAGLGLSLLGGLILNVMPCVLPIIPLRIYSLVQMASESRRRYVTLGLAFAGGIVLFFAAIGAVNVVLKLTASRALDLNTQFQVPALRIALTAILLALAANLFGLFEVVLPGRVSEIGQEQKRQGHLAGAGMGFMMAVLATPCSFAVLAVALAWAQLQDWPVGAAAFVVMGVGMAAPHVLLAAFPRLLNRLPKPGRWMERFKQTMGFLLLPAVLYLLSTFAETAWPFLIAGWGLALVFGLWVLGSWVRYDAPAGRKWLARGLAAAALVGLGFLLLPKPPAPAVKFEPFSAARIAEARQNGRPVVVKVTATWCTNCKILENTVYSERRLAEAFAARDVVAVKADVTDRGTPADRWLRRQPFYAQPPLTVVLPPGDGKPISKVGLFEVDDLIGWLEQATAKPPPAE